MAKLSLLLGVLILLFPIIGLCREIFGLPRTCSTMDMRIYQSQIGFTALNIPKYMVEMINEAWQVDAVFNVEISCTAFASFDFVDPMVFRRIDECCTCLLKGGGKINQGESITFEYSNTLPYELAVTRVNC
ncbi:TPD1 protein homolog 1B-like protein [Tanacetum coccineum]